MLLQWYISGKAGEPQNISSAKNIHIKAVPSGLPGGKEFVIPKEDRYGWQISGDPKEVVFVFFFSLSHYHTLNDFQDLHYRLQKGLGHHRGGRSGGTCNSRPRRHRACA